VTDVARPPDPHGLFVANLAADAKPWDLAAVFKAYGPVGHVRLRPGHAWVQFAREANVDLDAVIAATRGTVVKGRPIRVERARGR
jgi:hypothetical protein